MTTFVDTLAKILKPFLTPVSTWLTSRKRRFDTWVYESCVVAATLAVVTLLATDWSSWRAIVANLAGAIGVFYTFSHASVAQHMAETQATMPMPSVECWPKAQKFWILKETAWIVAFIASGLYSALVGSILFLIYPAWRKIHVENRVIIRASWDKTNGT